MKVPVDVIVDEHNHQELTSVAPVPLAIPTRPELLPSAIASSPRTTYPSPQSAITPMTRSLNISPKTSHDQLAPPVKPSIITAVPNVNSAGSVYDIQSPKQTKPRTGLLNGLERQCAVVNSASTSYYKFLFASNPQLHSIEGK